MLKVWYSRSLQSRHIVRVSSEDLHPHRWHFLLTPACPLYTLTIKSISFCQENTPRTPSVPIWNTNAYRMTHTCKSQHLISKEQEDQEWKLRLHSELKAILGCIWFCLNEQASKQQRNKKLTVHFLLLGATPELLI